MKKRLMLTGILILIAGSAICGYYAARKDPYICASRVFNIDIPSDSRIEICEIQYNYSSFPDMTVKIKARLSEEGYKTVLTHINELGDLIPVEEAYPYISQTFLDQENVDIAKATDMYFRWENGSRKMTYYKTVVFTKEPNGERYMYIWGM